MIFLTWLGFLVISTRRSPRKIASSISEVTKNVVLCDASKRRRKCSCISSRVIASRPRNGSSISISFGSLISARASSARRCMPPDN